MKRQEADGALEDLAAKKYGDSHVVGNAANGLVERRAGTSVPFLFFIF